MHADEHRRHLCFRGEEMQMSLKRATALLLLLSLPAWAADRDNPPAGKSAPTKTEPEKIPGYRVRKIKGFQLIISNKVLEENDKSDLERKPLDVLELELKTLSKVMPPKALEVLRKILIWVEWDEQVKMANGRDGFATAIYYGGHQLQMLEKGQHPLKAKNVTILRMKSLAEEHQPKRDSGRCVILHEIAHAVHDQLIGFDNQKIKDAYRQAMQRKLYDPTMYASTNEKEFFAELTCAYFDQMDYYPRKRADLKKHDLATYQVMELVWSKQKVAKDSGSDPSPRKLQDLKLEQVDLGKPILGPKVTAADLRGRAVMLLLWNAGSTDSLACFSKVSAWDAELSDFGLLTVGIHFTGTSKQEVEAVARSRGVAFAVTEGKWVKGGLIEDFKDFPLCLVFDHDAHCVYRGSPFDAEKAVRAAVGKALAASTGLETFPKPLTRYVEELGKGQPPSSVLPKLAPLMRWPDADTAEAAKLLVGEMTEAGHAALRGAEPLAKTDPVAAFILIERLPTVFKDTAVAAGANKLLDELKKNKAVATELRARKDLAAVKKIDTELNGRPGSFDPKLEQFRRENALLLAQLQQKVQQMKKAYPMAKATEQAVRISDRYGLTVP
jgi:hypothetical protein